MATTMEVTSGGIARNPAPPRIATLDLSCSLQQPAISRLRRQRPSPRARSARRNQGQPPISPETRLDWLEAGPQNRLEAVLPESNLAPRQTEGREVTVSGEDGQFCAQVISSTRS